MDNFTYIAVFGLGILFCAIAVGGTHFYFTMAVDGVKTYREMIKDAIQNIPQLFRNPSNHSLQYRFAMPILFLFVAPIGYWLFEIIAEFMNTHPYGTGNSEGIFVILGGLLFFLAIVVLGFWGRSEKNITIKFWLELSVAIALEVSLIMELSWFMTDFFVEDLRDMRLFIGFACVSIPLFINYVRHTQENWHALLNIKQEQEEEQ